MRLRGAGTTNPNQVKFFGTGNSVWYLRVTVTCGSQPPVTSANYAIQVALK